MAVCEIHQFLLKKEDKSIVMTEKMRLRHAIVGYIDILGASEMIKTDNGKSLKKVHAAYEDAILLYQKLTQLVDKAPEIKIYSDNIIVYCYTGNRNPCTALRKVVILSGLIQYQLLCYDILSRGGIAEGTFFADDTMIWGSALVKAYGIEDSVAIYPRVVLDEDLYQKYVCNENNDLKQFLYDGEDGLKMVDFLSYFYIPGIDDSSYHDFNIYLQNRIEAALIKSNMKILQKDVWFDQYIFKKWREYEHDVKHIFD